MIGKSPDSPSRRAPGHHGAGAVELAVQVSPLPVAVLRRRRLEISLGGGAVLELQGHRRGCDVRPVAFSAFGLAESPASSPGLLGSFLGLTALGAWLPTLRLASRAFRKGVRPPLPEDRRKGEEACPHQGDEQSGWNRVSPGPTFQPADVPTGRARIGSWFRTSSSRRPAPRPWRTAYRAPSPGTSGRSSAGRAAWRVGAAGGDRFPRPHQVECLDVVAARKGGGPSAARRGCARRRRRPPGRRPRLRPSACSGAM